MSNAGKDMREWRKEVGRWVQLVKAANDVGTDRAFKTLFYILGQTLNLEGLPKEQQLIVDEAQSNHIIDYMQTESPVKAVMDIVKIVAVDPLIAMVTRLI